MSDEVFEESNIVSFGLRRMLEKLSERISTFIDTTRDRQGRINKGAQMLEQEWASELPVAKRHRIRVNTK